MYKDVETRVYYRFEEIEDDEPLPATIDVAPSSKLASTFADTEPGYWSRQFARETTAAQRKADWIFGVLLPLICFYFDPFIFRLWEGSGEGMLGRFQRPVYTFAFASIMTLSAWLLWGERLGGLRRPAAFLMSAAAIMAAVFGVVLFPFSMVGLLAIIGILGFTPMFTCIIYLRNAVRAFRSADSTPDA